MKVTPENCFHLTVEIVKEIHAHALDQFGGSTGLREPSLLESAVAAPQATMMGQPMIEDPIEAAASYLFYLCRNHPFVDGNKRAALATCLVFLSQNGLLPKEIIDHDELEAFVLDVAASRIDRDETTRRLKLLILDV